MSIRFETTLQWIVLWCKICQNMFAVLCLTETCLAVLVGKRLLWAISNRCVCSFYQFQLQIAVNSLMDRLILKGTDIEIPFLFTKNHACQLNLNATTGFRAAWRMFCCGVFSNVENGSWKLNLWFRIEQKPFNVWAVFLASKITTPPGSRLVFEALDTAKKDN